MALAPDDRRFVPSKPTPANSPGAGSGGNHMVRKIIASVAFGSVLLLPLAAAGPGDAVAAQPSLVGAAALPSGRTGVYKNCTAFNAKYKHGVGKKGAKDKVSGKSKPVTTFKRSTAIYKKAMANNSGLDRDKDGVACEKR